MKSGLTDDLRFVFSRELLRRNLLIALVVVGLLSLANQFDVILRESFTTRLGLRLFFNFLIPLAVSSVSAAINREAAPRCSLTHDRFTKTRSCHFNCKHNYKSLTTSCKRSY